MPPLLVPEVVCWYVTCSHLLVGLASTSIDFLCWLQVLVPLQPLVQLPLPLVLPSSPSPPPQLQLILRLESTLLGYLLALVLVCVVALATVLPCYLLSLVLVCAPSELATYPLVVALSLTPPLELVLAALSLIVLFAW